jgi:hypothetical protein
VDIRKSLPRRTTDVLLHRAIHNAATSLSPSPILFAVRAISVRIEKLLSDVQTTEPADVPGRLIVSNPALRVPATVGVLVVLPVIVVQILSLGIRAVHTVQAQAVEVLIGIGLRLQNNRLPIPIIAADACSGVAVAEGSKTVDNLLDRRGADYVVDGEHVDLGEGVEVAANSRVLALALAGVVAPDMAILLVETLVESGLETAAGVVHGTCEHVSELCGNI